MANFSNRREREEMQELLRIYQNLKSGRSSHFIEEEDFERLINYFDDKQDLASAIEAADVGIEQFPYSAQLKFKKADLLIANRQYLEALDLLDAGALFDSNDTTLYILKTDAYLALDQPEKAAEQLEEALELFEGDERIELLFELSDVYDDYEDFEKVFDCLKLILEEDPLNEEALLKICFWADFTGRCEESIRLHQSIIEEHPFSELAWFNLATAFQGLKLYEKAIDAYQYALAIDEKLDIAYRNMGDAYIRIRKYREAIESLNKVLELSRPEDVIHEAIGHCYHKLENFAQARFHYRKASHLNPDDSRIYYKIAVTYCKEDQWEAAVKQLETAMRIHKSQPEFNLLMGECKMVQGKLKEAIQYFLNVIRVRPKNVSGYDALIRALIKAEEYDEALKHCRVAEEHAIGSALFVFYQSGVLFLMGKTKEALVQLERAMRENPRLFNRLSDLVPGLLQRTQVVEILSRYVRKKKRG
ncbi:MAG: tetratricopeptide repeat protein [Chitinophagaceae bacterium]|jgi:tetratricopeptide (TPR) repeat protein|nr:tetratricopeptide repeat protein [Chitinophagaceae bacterium]